jgi:tRNA A-37 threonylcarbamoyl transferase component Bud32
MAAYDQVQHGVSLALEAHRRKLLDDRRLDAILQYYDAEGARDPFPAAEVLARIGGLPDEALRSLFGGPAPSPSDVQGEKFGDRLTLLDKIGEGGMGAVFRAYDKVLKRGVAVKRLRIDHLDGKGAAKMLARFEREAHAMARVRHPACVQIFDAGLTPKGEPYLVMEFVAGQSLRAVIEERYGHDAPHGSDPLLAPMAVASARPARPLEPQAVARLGASLAEALQACHDVGLVHRDVKPANILLDAAGTPRLTDFGVALDDRARTKLTVDRAMVGTLAYMAPEQALGEAVDARCDVYALGVTLYEALCGQPPHDAGAALVLLRQVLSAEPAPLHTLRPDVPRDLETIVHKCLSKAAGDRYATAQALALDLRRFLADEPVLAQPVSGVQRLARRVWRARRWVGGGIAALVVLAAALGVARLRERQRLRADVQAAVDAAAVASDLDAAEARVLPLIAVAAPDDAERAREALRALRGRRRLRDAEAAFARWRGSVTREGELRQEASTLRETIDPQQEFKTSPDKQRLVAIDGEIEQAKTDALAALLETERFVAQAAADEAAGVDALRVRILVDRARDVEDRTPEAAARLFKEADGIVGRVGDSLGVDLGRPVVVVECDPPTAKVTLSRYHFDPTEGLMVPTEVDRAESTPATLRGDEVGDYRLEVTAPGYLVARDLLQLSRGTRRTVKLSLVSEASLGPLAGLVVHVPAGEARWGEDLATRQQVDECLIMRDENSYPAWTSFVIHASGPAAAVPIGADRKPLLSTPQLVRWPAVAVSWNGVTSYLTWLQSEMDLAGLAWTVRLPSAAVYFRALRGEFSWRFPWGDTREPTFMVSSDANPTAEISRDYILSVMRNTEDRSGFGLRNLAGGVSEFVRSSRDGAPAQVGGNRSASLWLAEVMIMHSVPVVHSSQSSGLGFRLTLTKQGTLGDVVTDRDQARRLAAEAAKSVQKSELADAHSLMTQAIQADREDGVLWSQRANVRRMLGDCSGAIWDYTVALTKSPRNPSLHVSRGLTHLAKGSFSEALHDLDIAVQLDSDSVGGWTARSRARVAAGDVEGARADAQEAHRLDPADPRTADALRLVEQAESTSR